MSTTVDELTCEWKDDAGNLTTRQLDKIVLTKGSWATLMYLYQDIDRKTGDFGKLKARIQRYQKRNGRYNAQSKFNFSSLKQAKKVADILLGWHDENPSE
jgi:hypothetical protein